jgi:hypothetical protein
MWKLAVAALVLLILIYILGGRAWLKTKPWAAGFFGFVEPLELALYRKSETILFARLKMLVGGLLFLLTQIGAVDVSPFMFLVPEAYQAYAHLIVQFLPLLISAVGAIDEWLRRDTTKPLAVVAIPDSAPAVVLQQVAKVEEQNVQAVAAIADAKASGAV